AQFDRTRYPEPARALSYDAMTKLAMGEYLAVDGFSRLVSGLSLAGAPFDLVASAARIPSDEIRHADLALRMAALVSGRKLEDVEVEVPRARSPLPPSAPPASLEALDLLMVQVPAVGETLAAALIMACQRRARDATAKAVLTSILSD